MMNEIHAVLISFSFSNGPKVNKTYVEGIYSALHMISAVVTVCCECTVCAHVRRKKTHMVKQTSLIHLFNIFRVITTGQKSDIFITVICDNVFFDRCHSNCSHLA